MQCVEYSSIGLPFMAFIVTLIPYVEVTILRR